MSRRLSAIRQVLDVHGGRPHSVRAGLHVVGPWLDRTRVKDLADLILVIETGLTADAALTRTVRHVFTARGTHSMPTEIADPPPAWLLGYPTWPAG